MVLVIAMHYVASYPGSVWAPGGISSTHTEPGYEAMHYDGFYGILIPQRLPYFPNKNNSTVSNKEVLLVAKIMQLRVN